MIKKTNLGFISILFTFILFGVLIPKTFAQATDVYVGVRFEEIYSPTAPDPANTALLTGTTITFNNDGADDIITLTSQVIVGDTVWSDLISLTSGNTYPVTIHPILESRIDEPTWEEGGIDWRIYGYSSSAEDYCLCMGGEYVTHETEIFEQCETCQDPTSCRWEDFACDAWPGGSFNCATDGGRSVYYDDWNETCYGLQSPWTCQDWEDYNACRYKNGCSGTFYTRLKSVTCQRSISDFAFSFTYTE